MRESVGLTFDAVLADEDEVSVWSSMVKRGGEWFGHEAGLSEWMGRGWGTDFRVEAAQEPLEAGSEPGPTEEMPDAILELNDAPPNTCSQLLTTQPRAGGAGEVQNREGGNRAGGKNQAQLETFVSEPAATPRERLAGFGQTTS